VRDRVAVEPTQVRREQRSLADAGRRGGEQLGDVDAALEHDEVVAVAETLLDRLELDAEEVDAIIQEVWKRKPANGETFLKVPPLDAPPQSIDFGVLGPVRDDIPRYAQKARPPRLQGQRKIAPPVAAADPTVPPISRADQAEPTGDR